VTVAVIVLALDVAGVIWLKRRDNEYESTTEQLTEEQRHALQFGIAITGGKRLSGPF
jgi:hypothetical protein